MVSKVNEEVCLSEGFLEAFSSVLQGFTGSSQGSDPMLVALGKLWNDAISGPLIENDARTL